MRPLPKIKNNCYFRLFVLTAHMWIMEIKISGDAGPTTQGWRSEELLGLSQGRSDASAVLTDQVDEMKESIISRDRFERTLSTIALQQGWWVTGGLVLSPLPLDPFSAVSLTTTEATELLEIPALLPLDPLNVTTLNPDFIEGPDLPFSLHKHRVA